MAIDFCSVLARSRKSGWSCAYIILDGFGAGSLLLGWDRFQGGRKGGPTSEKQFMFSKVAEKVSVLV